MVDGRGYETPSDDMAIDPQRMVLEDENRGFGNLAGFYSLIISSRFLGEALSTASG